MSGSSADRWRTSLRWSVTSALQACMYRPLDIAERAKQIADINRQLDVLEGIVVGPHVIGDELSSADAAIFPTLVFMNFMLPRFFKWADVFKGRPHLKSYWECMNEDPAGAKVRCTFPASCCAVAWNRLCQAIRQHTSGAACMVVICGQSRPVPS